MKSRMAIAQGELEKLLEAHVTTRGMYVRVYGDHLIMGRREVVGANDEEANIDSVRLTHVSGSTYGLSVKRHTGRWEKVPFSGTIPEMVDAIQTFMQHLVAPY